MNKGIADAQASAKEKMNSVTGGMLSGLNTWLVNVLVSKSANLLIEQLAKLPGVGKATAQRLAFLY